MRLVERAIEVAPFKISASQLAELSRSVRSQLPPDELPIRCVITRSTESVIDCEVGIMEVPKERAIPENCSVFDFVRRTHEISEKFNAVLLVPTGIGAEIGGHDGDAGPVAKLLSSICDTLIVHPNVVNASDINEIPENALYVEGSVISRMMMGTVGLQPVRSNRIIVIIDAHKDDIFSNAAINSVGSARATYGLNCSRVVKLDPSISMTMNYATSGRAVGTIDNLTGLFSVLDDYRNEYDAIAISSVIKVPHRFHFDYLDPDIEMVNPWGGIEAMLTHAVSSIYSVPSAHAPMFESRDIANFDPGVVEPRKAAEAVSVTFLNSVLKGLHRSPRIITNLAALHSHGIISAKDISCLVIPDGCIGLPTLAALEQGITVIAVRENRNIMKNDLQVLPWAPGQLHMVENYLEAAGIMAALQAGIVPESVRRPLADTPVELKSTDGQIPSSKNAEYNPNSRLANRVD